MFEAALRLALQWPYGGRDKRGKCRGIGKALPEVLPGKSAGQELSSTSPEVPERHSDTEEVTGSNPVRPTTSKAGIERLEQALGAIPGAKAFETSSRSFRRGPLSCPT